MDLTLSLNHACNLRCKYCYGGAKFHRPMSMDTASKALDIGFARAAPTLRLHFFGGEPLLETGLIERIAVEARRRSRLAGKPLRMGLTTNGTLLTDQRLDLVERYGFNLTVSIDGVREAHDASRVLPDGSGSWDRVIAGLERAVSRFDQVNTISVIHPGNLEWLPASFDLIASLGIRRISFSLDYDAEWGDDALSRLSLAYEALADRVIARYRAGYTFTIQPFHTKIVSRLKDGLSAEDRCDFGCMELAVAPSGNLYPCDRLIGEDGPAQHDVCIGQVSSGVKEVVVRGLKRSKDRSKPDCRQCAIVDRCVWWCGCVNRSLTGRVDGVSGLLCELEKLGVRVADRIASTLYAEGNEAFLRRYYLGPASRVYSRGDESHGGSEPGDAAPSLRNT